MSCSIAEELTAYLDGELPVFQLKQIESHLSSCAECRGAERLLRRTIGRLAALPYFQLSPATRRAVLSRIDEAPGRRIASGWQTRWWQVVFPSLGLVAAAVIAMVISGKQSIDLRDPGLFDVAANLELAEDYEVLGVTNLVDLEVVQHLHELEGSP